MWSTAREIAAGDLVIIWMTREQLQPLVVVPGKELNNKFGVYRHADLVGVAYGSKVGSRNGRGFVHVLRPTPELWTRALPHRTQILYLADIAFVGAWLDVRPGAVVVEAGTGSGSFSHSVARTVGPRGHLHSYEFHAARADKAREEFARHGMDNVTLTHRNVCKDGFTVVDAADAVFLDLPAPWDAVEHARAALRQDRVTRICSFSPCMEQVLRTVAALNDAGFSDITMYEALQRPHEVSAPPAPAPSVAAAAARLRDAERRREDKRLRQIAAARARHAGRGHGEDARGQEEEEAPGLGQAMEGSRVGEKRKRAGGGDGDETEAAAGESTASDTPATAVGSKKPRTASPVPGPSTAPSTAAASTAAATATATTTTTATAAAAGTTTAGARTTLSKAFPEVRGHTSYLTFARLVPAALLRGTPAALAAPTATATGTAGAAADGAADDEARAALAAPDRAAEAGDVGVSEKADTGTGAGTGAGTPPDGDVEMGAAGDADT